MNNELTITLTGKAAKDYISEENKYNTLVNKYTNVVDTAETAISKYDVEVDKNLKLLDKVDELTAEVSTFKADLLDAVIAKHTAKPDVPVFLEVDPISSPTEHALGEVITDANTTIQHIMDKYPTDNSEKDTTISEVIEPNPVTFPAITNNKSKSGTHWTEDELAVVKRSLESNYTLAFLKVKLSNRSEAAIRSMLLNYDIGVKKNKLYAK